MLETVTLDQLRMFVAVADRGSFTAAAKSVQRAQSAVSHAMANLEAQLDVALFDRTAKRPTLTSAGVALLADARATLARMDGLKARARGLSQGIEGKIGLAISVLVAGPVILEVLAGFRDAYPTVALDLFVEEIGGPTALVLDETCEIGISGGFSVQAAASDKLIAIALGAVDVLAVAAPDHPLAQVRGHLTEADLRDHRQLVPTSRTKVAYHNALAQDAWQVADLGLRREMLVAGLGWGTVPQHLVEEDLSTGRLVRLSLAPRAQQTMQVPLFAIHRADTPPGPAGRWLVRRFGEGLSGRHSSPEIDLAELRKQLSA